MLWAEWLSRLWCHTWPFGLIDYMVTQHHVTVTSSIHSISERVQEISELLKLHIQGVWQNAHTFITQLIHVWNQRVQLSMTQINYTPAIITLVFVQDVHVHYDVWAGSGTSVASVGLAVLSSRYFTTFTWFSWAAMYSGVKPVCTASHRTQLHGVSKNVPPYCDDNFVKS